MLLYSLTQHDDCTCSYIDNPTISCYSVELMACLAVHLYISMTLKFCVYHDLSYYHTKDRHSALICLAKKIHNLKHIFHLPQNRHCKACTGSCIVISSSTSFGVQTGQIYSSSPPSCKVNKQTRLFFRHLFIKTKSAHFCSLATGETSARSTSIFRLPAQRAF